MRVLFATIVILTGIITRYDGADQDPLRCATRNNQLYYGDDTDTPWIALDIKGLGDLWKCGDEGILFLSGYPPLRVVVLDSGAFGDHCVIQPDGQCIAIVADIPTRFAPFAPDLSVRGSFVLVPVSRRAMEVDR